MKQKDIALIIVVAFISVLFAVLLSKAIFNNANDRKLTAEVVTPITTEFNSDPDKRYFNQESIDPTQIIRIGGNSNEQPFEGQ